MATNEQQLAAIRAVADVILGTVEDMGATGAPSGVLYAGLLDFNGNIVGTFAIKPDDYVPGPFV